jgi:hypothetical protein
MSAAQSRQRRAALPPIIPTIIPVIIILSAVACGRPSTGQRIDETVIEGVRTVRTVGGPKYEGPLFELESDLVLGVDEGQPAWQMFSMSPVLLVAPDGRMVLVDIRLFQIWIVSSEGYLLKQLGGKGSGPGEFQNMLDVFWAEEGREFWITDQANSRISRFSIDGEYLGEINYSITRMTFSRFQHLQDRRFLATGTIRQGSTPTDERERYAILDDRLEVVQDLFELEGGKFFRIRERGYAPSPFTAMDSILPLPDGGLLQVQPNLPRLRVYDGQFAIAFDIVRDWPVVPVTQAECDQIEKNWRESGIMDSGIRIPFPDHKPPFTRAYVDTEGRIWLSLYEAIREEGTEGKPGRLIGYQYEIYSPDGVWLGNHLQRETIRHLTGEHMYVSYSSEGGAPRLERKRIVPLVPEMRPRGR